MDVEEIRGKSVKEIIEYLSAVRDKADGGRVGLYQGGNPHAGGYKSGSYSRSYNPGAGGVVQHGPTKTHHHGGDGGNNRPPVITPKKKPHVIPQDNDSPWYSPKQLIDNPLLNFIDPRSKLGLGLNLFKTIKNFKPKDEDLILSENVTLPSENLLAFTPGSLKDKKLKQLHNQKKEGLMWNEQNEKTYQKLLEEDKKSATPTVLSADGGRVGFQTGGWADNLTGQAAAIYQSMIKLFRIL